MSTSPGAEHLPESPDHESTASDSNTDLNGPSSTASTPDVPPQSPSSPLAQPPTFKSNPDGSNAAGMSSSSTPLGPLNAARRPGPPPSRSSNLTSDIQARMKAFSLSRQGAPPPGTNLRLPPNVPGKPVSTGQIPTQSPAPGGALSGSTGQSPPPSSPGGALSGGLAGLRLPPGMSRPNAPTFNSSPSAPGAKMGSKPPMGGLAAKRGLKGAGMKLSDAMGPPAVTANGGEAQAQEKSTDSAFSKYSEYIDTKAGTLNFKGKAIISGTGVEFSSGSSFNISLDEVDTMDELGKGNYGTVYKVRHSRPRIRRPGQGLRGNLPRPSGTAIASVTDDTSIPPPAAGTTGVVMAMKEIRLELDDTKFAQIIMELDLLHRCVSPFIIDFYGAFFQEGAVYICMEWMDGGSIDKLYGDGIPEGPLRKITLSTVMGLKYLKDEHNIIHRDVKPTNILCNSNGQVKICDFGVSGNLVASIAKTNIGCQSYMAPERISGGGVASAGAAPSVGTYSVQSDIWSLALTIIECAMGRYPYPPETYDNIFSQLSAIVEGEPPDLPPDTYSEAARDFVRGCLNKIPKLRPTYAMLLRHAWLAPLMKPPTISEEDEEDENGEASTAEPLPLTADKEVGDWVKAALERRAAGRMAKNAKPALHAAPLDAAVPGSPLKEQTVTSSAPAPGVAVS